jgi:hypothetical protein
VIPAVSRNQLRRAALGAMADCGLKPKDIDGVAPLAVPVQIAAGITPTGRWRLWWRCS